ncbi:unnamed protein product, partial [Urochloa humidicola]
RLSPASTVVVEEKQRCRVVRDAAMSAATAPGAGMGRKPEEGS